MPMDMGYGQMASSAIGLGVGLIGTALGASQADKARREVQNVANTPGIDFTMLARDAISGYNANYGAALDLSQRLSRDQQAIINAQEEQALPGLGVARGEALGKIRGLFADDATWLKGVQRRGAALGIGRGLGGSGAGQIGTLRLSDQEQNQRTSLGTSLLGSLIGGMRLANTPGVVNFLGPSMSEQLATRSNERTQKMNIMLGRASMPTSTGYWGSSLQQLGGAMMGASLQGGQSDPLKVDYEGPGNAPKGWSNLSSATQNYYNDYARTTPMYGAGINFE